MMKKFLLLSLFAAAVLSVALPSHAYWTFLTYTGSNWAMCTGEPDYSGGDPSCDVTTTWGTRVKTSLVSGKCAATIYCPNDGFVKTCLASEGGGSTPGDPWSIAMCYSTTSQGGTHKAVCKSDIGWFALYC
jgi:hypothetical protein